MIGRPTPLCNCSPLGGGAARHCWVSPRTALGRRDPPAHALALLSPADPTAQDAAVAADVAAVEATAAAQRTPTRKCIPRISSVDTADPGGRTTGQASMTLPRTAQ